MCISGNWSEQRHIVVTKIFFENKKMLTFWNSQSRHRGAHYENRWAPLVDPTIRKRIVGCLWSTQRFGNGSLGASGRPNDSNTNRWAHVVDPTIRKRIVG